MLGAKQKESNKETSEDLVVALCFLTTRPENDLETLITNVDTCPSWLDKRKEHKSIGNANS